MRPDASSWHWDLEALVLVPALALAYLLATHGRPLDRRRAACFFAGLLLITAVSITPLQTIALNYLLSAHLLQNVVLAEWAPALCVLGIPPFLAATIARLPLARPLTWPPAALATWLAVYFTWHLPFAYEAALRHQATLLHLEHASYFAAGCLLWWPVLQDEPWRLREGARAMYLFAAFLLASPLGLLLALIPEPIYDWYEDGPGLWGLSPLADQQIAGVTMSLEQAFVFFAACTYFFLRALGSEERGEAFRSLTNPGRRPGPRRP
jgi:cytochrome c oxidase assembly factor CtaG